MKVRIIYRSDFSMAMRNVRNKCFLSQNMSSQKVFHLIYDDVVGRKMTSLEMFIPEFLKFMSMLRYSSN